MREGNAGQELRDRLADALVARDISAHRASVEADLPPNHVSRIIQGDIQRPQRETLEKLARYFGWPVDVVLGWAGQVPERKAVEFDPLVELNRLLLRVGFSEQQRTWFTQAFEMALQAMPPRRPPNPE